MIDSSDIFYPSPYDVDIDDLHDLEHIKKYVDAVDALPLSSRKILMDTTTAIVINKTLRDAFSLSESQAKELTRVVRDVLLSKIYVGDLVDEIAKRLGVATEVAQKIANELVAKVFKSAMEDIKALQVANFSDRIGKPTGDNVLNLRKK